MDPWDVDVSLLSNKFLERLKKYKSMDLKISGKILLAAAILLRVKSTRFMDEDINALDALIATANEPELEDGFEDLMDYENLENGAINLNEKPNIYPRTPQPRKRKVSVFDLVNALEKALHVFKRRPAKIKEKIMKRAPQKSRDISLIIKDVYGKITNHFEDNGTKAPKLTFSLLLPADSKEDKIFTFMPLLHLENQRKVDLLQEQHFGEIEIELLKNSKVSD